MDLNQPFSSGLLAFTDQGDFDYGAFLQGEDIGFGESAHGLTSGGGAFSDDSGTGKATPPSSDNRSNSNSTSHSTSNSTSNSAGTSIGTGQVARRPPAQKQRLERRGHTKSRRGCYNCKRRRIKVLSLPLPH